MITTTLLILLTILMSGCTQMVGSETIKDGIPCSVTQQILTHPSDTLQTKVQVAKYHQSPYSIYCNVS